MFPGQSLPVALSKTCNSRAFLLGPLDWIRGKSGRGGPAARVSGLKCGAAAGALEEAWNQSGPGPPAALARPFFGWEGSPSKID